MNRYDWSFRSLPPMIRASAIHKVDAARGAIIQHRVRGINDEDDDAVVRQFDLSGINEFWEIELSEPMECEIFAQHLSIHFFSVADRNASDIVRINLLSALRSAHTHKEPWIIEAQTPHGLRIRPLDASIWLLSRPKRRHLIPPSLAQYLKGEFPLRVETVVAENSLTLTAPKIAITPKRRGARPTISGSVAEAMREALEKGEMSVEQLGGMIEKTLAARFGASRDTVRKVRSRVLSEFVGRPNPDKSQANDK